MSCSAADGEVAGREHVQEEERRRLVLQGARGAVEGDFGRAVAAAAQSYSISNSNTDRVETRAVPARRAARRKPGGRGRLEAAAEPVASKL